MYNVLTPFRLDMLMFYYSRPGIFPNNQCSAYVDAIDFFITNGILVQTGDLCYKCTARGRKYVEMLLTTPFPTQLWIDPRNFQNETLTKDSIESTQSFAIRTSKSRQDSTGG